MQDIKTKYVGVEAVSVIHRHKTMKISLQMLLIRTRLDVKQICIFVKLTSRELAGSGIRILPFF